VALTNSIPNAPITNEHISEHPNQEQQKNLVDATSQTFSLTSSPWRAATASVSGVSDLLLPLELHRNDEDEHHQP
jgi:hypothetical protein